MFARCCPWRKIQPEFPTFRLNEFENAGNVDNTPTLLSEGHDSDGDAMDLPGITLELVMNAIASAAMDAAAAATRGLANATDPGYRDMRKGYKEDPCAMKC